MGARLGVRLRLQSVKHDVDLKSFFLAFSPQKIDGLDFGRDQFMRLLCKVCAAAPQEMKMSDKESVGHTLAWQSYEVHVFVINCASRFFSKGNRAATATVSRSCSLLRNMTLQLGVCYGDRLTDLALDIDLCMSLYSHYQGCQLLSMFQPRRPHGLSNMAPLGCLNMCGSFTTRPR